MTKFLNISTDGTLGGDSPSDEIVASQKAIKTYVDTQNVGTVTSVNNVTPDTNGNVTLTIPTINSTNNYVPYRSGASSFSNSSLMYNSNAMAFTGRLHVGSSSPASYYNKGRFTVYDNTPAQQVTSLALLNYGGGGGCGVAVDMYNTSANGGIPSGRFGVIDNGNYSGYLQLQVKKSGAQSNPLLPAMNIVPVPASNSLTTCVSFGQDEFNRVLFDLHKPEAITTITDSDKRWGGSGTTYQVTGSNKFNPRLLVAVGDIVSFNNFSTEATVTGVVSNSTTLQITTDKTLGTVSNASISVKKAYFKITDESNNIKVYVDPYGKFGIGTGTPAYDLDVNGIINASTDVKVNGNSIIPNNPTITITQGGTTKGSFTLNQLTDDTIDIDVGGAVDSVNGQTGTVVLDAEDVGALPDTTDIPTDTSDLTNGAGFITSSALSGYATETWVGQQGYITGITSSDVTTALGFTPYNSTNPSGYQANVIETVKVNGTELTPSSKAVDISVPTNNNQLTNGAGYITSSALSGYATQTWVGQQGFITGITSSDVTSALGFTPYNSTNPAGYITSSALSGYATQSWVGQQGYLTSSDLSDYARLSVNQTFTGNQSFTGGLYRKAVWAVGTAPSSNQYNNIQLQDSTGNQWGSFGLRYNTDGSLELRQNLRFLNGTNNWSFFSLISKTGNATEIRGKADAVTFESDKGIRLHLQDNSITKGTNPSTTKYNQIVFNDGSNSSEWANSRLGLIQHIVDTSGTTKLQLSANRFYSGSATAATIETSITKDGVASCSFPNTTCVDSAFTSKAASICSGVTLNGSGGYDYTLTDLPNDGQNYMVLIHATATSGSTSGNNALIQIKSSVLTSSLNVVRAYTRTSSTMQASASAWIPVGSNRVLHLNQSTGWNGTASIDMKGYRRIGTNE